MTGMLEISKSEAAVRQAVLQSRKSKKRYTGLKLNSLWWNRSTPGPPRAC